MRGSTEKVSEKRSMLYLSEALYQKSVARARKEKKSLAALIREALENRLTQPFQSNYEKAVSAVAGMWKNRSFTGIQYEDRLRNT